MLLHPGDWSLASRIDDVLPALSGRVADCARAETHGSALELASRPAFGTLVSAMAADFATSSRPAQLGAATVAALPGRA